MATDLLRVRCAQARQGEQPGLAADLGMRSADRAGKVWLVGIVRGNRAFTIRRV